MKKYLAIIFTSLLLIGIAFADTVTIQSDKQVYDGENNKIHLDGKVKVKMNNITLQSPRAVGNLDPNTGKMQDASFLDNAYAYQIKGSKKQEIKAEIIKMSLLTKVLTSTGNTQSIISEKTTPILTINADEQAYNTTNDIVTANGGVVIHYKDIETFSNSASAFVTQNGDLKRLELTGNGKIRQKNNKLDADKFIYNAQTEDYISTGHAYSDINPDEETRLQVWSNYQEYNQKSGIVTASGTVKIFYNEYRAYGPKATVFPDPKTGKMNKIVFSGRSKIEQDGRSIEADHITMTMKPKNFTADGNVKTTIENTKDLKDKIK